ncbi:typical proliferating cell nuclear antigen [Artemisia annua]|uniref:Typical proliferating cell nuclear antigen n=1 Tax=Artemisia annua TaxID=35608 RepID=A0A2U1L4E1_ARTAN|nr:typical proliferating cell nuclear antigen [Artemisia annua]
MKLMDNDGEHLGIPQAEYHAILRMSSTEFARICKDLSSIGDTVISVTKEGVKFSTRGDIGTANVVCRQNTTVDKISGNCSAVKESYVLCLKLSLITGDSELYSTDMVHTKVCIADRDRSSYK